MKKNDVSKKAASMMKNLRKDQLDRAAGGLVIKPGLCETCGLLHAPGLQ